LNISSRARLFLTALSLATLLVSYSSGNVNGVTNGIKISKAPPWAAYITTVNHLYFTQAGETSCSGAIVASHWILTAAHCVTTESSSGGQRPISPRKFEVVLGRNQLSKTLFSGAQWSADRAYAFPGWNGDPASGDVGLIHVRHAFRASARPLALAPSGAMLTPRSDLRSFGYGLIEEYWSKHALRAEDPSQYSGVDADFLYQIVRGSYQYSSGCSNALQWCVLNVGESTIRNGDSGGPWMAASLPNAIVGLSSAGIVTQITPKTFIFGQLDLSRVTSPSIHDWIQRTAGIISADPGTLFIDQDHGDAWLVDRYAVAHQVRRGAVKCQERYAARVVTVDAFRAAELPRATGEIGCTKSL
jgi:hypothetical protein